MVSFVLGNQATPASVAPSARDREATPSEGAQGTAQPAPIAPASASAPTPAPAANAATARGQLVSKKIGGGAGWGEGMGPPGPSGVPLCKKPMKVPASEA
eukprot:1160323-Pelagomonas_calceolata.AAC.2